MEKTENLRNLETDEMLEDSYLVGEYLNLERLKDALKKRDLTEVHLFEERVEDYEKRLERQHRRTLEHLRSLRGILLNEDDMVTLRDLEEQISAFRWELAHDIIRTKQTFERLVERGAWEDIDYGFIDRLEEDIEAWLAIDRRLMDFEEKMIKRD
jgi:hypothetical protein